jgi:hypothetical protein
MVPDVVDYVRTCHHCQVNKARNQEGVWRPQSLGVPSERWEEVSMDFLGGLPKSGKHGYTYMVVFVDRLTKQIHIAPCLDS